MLKQLLMIGILLLSLVACNNESETKTNTEIFISAAASLSGALKEISKDFETKYQDVSITLNFSGSGKLAQQIQQGAPVDLFLSADQHWMNVLEQNDLLLADTRTNFIKNKLVLITQEDATLKANSLNTINPSMVDKIAIGNPESVPAGSYAKEAMTHAGIWDELTEHFVYAKDVRQVLTYVESGNVELGFVYKSDLKRASRVKVVTTIDSDLYKPIVYPAAVTSNSDHPEVAKRFIEYLKTDSAQVVLEKYGFSN